jgi:hypothetical protein
MSHKVFHMDRESIRLEFHPSKVKILFVGESPPANGAFFYVCSPMTTYMCEVFSEVLGKEFQSPNDFLNFFQDKGCYLDDLSYEPVNHLLRTERRQSVKDGVVELAKRMEKEKPEYVIVLLNRIEDQVREAARQANLPDSSVYVVPFPGQGHQRSFVKELSKILNRIYCLGNRKEENL